MRNVRFETTKAEFRHGLFDSNAIETLDIYTDGLVVSSRSDTDFIDEFIADLVAWLKNEHGYSVVETHTVSKMYESTLLVETHRDVFQPFEAYAEILRMIEKALLDASGLEITYENFGLVLSADQTRNPALKSPPFRFERKEGIDFSRHQFFTSRYTPVSPVSPAAPAAPPGASSRPGRSAPCPGAA